MEQHGSGGRRELFLYRFGSVEFDEGRFELRVAGLVVEVQRKPLDVLRYLLSHGGTVVSKEELLERLWTGMLPVDNVVGNAIAKLRAALGEHNAGYIVTQPRVGYRIAAAIECIPIRRGSEAALFLEPGGPVPGRANFVLELPLATHGAIATWQARHAHSRERRIYRFAQSGDDLAQLKREVSIFRRLCDSLPDVSAYTSILDWSLDTAPYFLECEFAGDNLYQWADSAALGGIAEEKRLQLICELVDAVAAAHGVGVLHTNITPDCIFVRQKGDTWMMRLSYPGSSDPLQGAIAINPYAAPEDLYGQAPTAQSDVYALGVILYQMLCGDLRKRLSPGWERSIGDPLLREDIAAATDGDPTRRIAAAQELSDRLRRLQERHSTQASLEAAAERAAQDAAAVRLARARRPWFVATVVALCAGLAAALLLSNRLLHAQRAQLREFAVAQALNNFFTSNFIAVANPTESGRKDVTVVEAATHAADNIDMANADPQIRGGLHAAMQSAFAGLSEVDASIAEGRKALDALALTTPFDARQAALVRLGLADLLAQSSKLDDAHQELRAVELLMTRSPIVDHTVQVRYLWARGRVASFRMNPNAALPDYRRAWQLAKSDSNITPELKDQLQFSYADTLRMDNQFVDAAAQADELLTRQRARLGATHAQACYTGVLVASIAGYLHHGDAAATGIAQEAAVCLSSRLGEASIRTASAYKVAADLQFQGEHYVQAASAYEHLAKMYKAILGEDTLMAISAQMNEGVSLQLAGRNREATLLLMSVLDIAEKALGWSAPTTETIRYHLADCELDARRTEGVAHLLDGLSTDALNAAQIEANWEGLLAYQTGRLEWLTGQMEAATALLEQAAKTLDTKHSEGPITSVSVQQFIASSTPASQRPGVYPAREFRSGR